MRRRLAALRRRSPPDAPEAVLASLAKAERMIDLGWSVAVLWGVMRLVAALWLWRGTGAYEAAWFVDPALAFTLAYGLYRRSRACAVLLLAYVVLELWIAYHVSGRPAGLGPALLLELSFLTGLRGTLQYHRQAASIDSEDG